jgi:serine/threonine protein kinase
VFFGEKRCGISPTGFGIPRLVWYPPIGSQKKLEMNTTSQELLPMEIHQRRRKREPVDQACWPSFTDTVKRFGSAFCAVLIGEHQISLQDFTLLRSVGKGAFGKVRVVNHKKTKATFALKYINKAKCLSMAAVDNIIEERRLLEAIETTFICNLRYAFQDDENMFMVIDLMLGGDLRFHMDRIGELREDHISLMVAEISLALDYLHSRNIVHRDIKPDNSITILISFIM